MDAELPQQSEGLVSHHLDVNDNDLRCHSVAMKPVASTDTSDMSQNAKLHVVKDKISSESDLRDFGHDDDNDRRHLVVSEIGDQMMSKSTSDLSDRFSHSPLQMVKDKRSSESALDNAAKVTSDIPSVLAILLNLLSVGNEAKSADPAKPTDDVTTSRQLAAAVDTDKHSTTEHCVVAMETPVTSGESRTEPVNDDVMISEQCVVTMETPITSGKIMSAPADDTENLTDSPRRNSEDLHTDEKHEDIADDEAVDLMIVESNNSYSEQSPVHEYRLLTIRHSPVDEQFDVTSSDSQLNTEQTTADKTLSAEFSSSPRNDDKNSNIIEYRTAELKSANGEKIANNSDMVVLSISEANVPDKSQLVDKSETSCVEPSVSSQILVDHPSLVVSRDQSNSSGIDGGERISQTADEQSTRPSYDSSQDLVMGNVDKSEQQQLQIVGGSMIRGNQLPEGTSPSLEQLKQNFVTRPPAKDFTFVLQRPVKASNERSLSTGSSYNTGSSNGRGIRPVYTFVMPTTVRRRSTSDYIKNDLSATRYSSSSTPHLASDGRKYDTIDTRQTTPLYGMTDSSRYNSWHAVDAAVHYGPHPVRTGSANIFDRKQLNSVGYSTERKRLSESSEELRYGDRTSLSSRPSQLSAALSSKPLKTQSVVTYSLSGGHVTAADHATASMPDLKSSSVDDVRYIQPRHDVMTSRGVIMNDDDSKEKTRDFTRSLYDVSESGYDVTEPAGVHDLCRSEPCLDVTVMSRDVRYDVDDGAVSHGLMRLRFESLQVETGSRRLLTPVGEDTEINRLPALGTSSSVPPRSSRVTQLRNYPGVDGSCLTSSSASDRWEAASSQHVISRRRPRRRRVVCLSPTQSSLTSPNNNDDVRVTTPS